uniref:Secreted protein n=1 Tax=Schistosoma mansoni TaxID=6183 RepID=A0A5K4F859_SCHMA
MLSFDSILHLNFVLLLLPQDVQFKCCRLLVRRRIQLKHFKQINRYIICCHNSFYNTTNYSPQKSKNTGQ